MHSEGQPNSFMQFYHANTVFITLWIKHTKFALYMFERLLMPQYFFKFAMLCEEQSRLQIATRTSNSYIGIIVLHVDRNGNK
jgi:hypothetical protein